MQSTEKQYTDKDDKTITETYDADGKLVKTEKDYFSDDNTKQIHEEYDANGNLQKKTYEDMSN